MDKEGGSAILIYDIGDSSMTKGYFTRDNLKEIVIDNKNEWIWQDDKDARLKRKLWLTEENYTNCNGDTSSSSCYDTSGNTATTYCANLTLVGLMIGGFQAKMNY